MSVNIKFPENPENGMIYEIIPGLFYQYNAGSNCWSKLEGVQSLGLATPLANGLMSKEDFNKLQNLVLPPPQATIKGEECGSEFKSGVVGLYSTDDSIEINKNLNLINPIANVQANTPWQLHKNTAGFDFRISIQRILEEVENRNKFKQIQLRGDKGPKGIRGEAGIDRLDTGPIGETGPDGANSPFPGALISESIPFEIIGGNNNRAIVDVTTEEISENENYLVVTRANIGNPDACPNLLSPKDFNSPLLVALNTIAGGKLVKDETVSSGDCSLICRVCASSLHHLNIEEIANSIHEQFLARIDYIKSQKEALAKIWLNTMINLFNEQKSALCCALENCRSRYRNERTRQYIETQRIQAAIGDFRLEIDGSADERQSTNMDAYKNCPVPTESTASVVSSGDNILINLDSKIHTADPRVNGSRAITTNLAPGSYIAEITNCCANFNDSINSPAYSGRAALLYQASVEVNGQTVVETSVLSFPDFGTFSSEAAAKNVYQGLTITFEHAGGDISLWLVDPDGFSANNDGNVQVTISPVVNAQINTTESDDFVYVYRDNISFDGLLGRIVPYAGSISSLDNFGSLPDDVDLTIGPTLDKETAQIFFYDGTDGLTFYFVAGEQPSISNTKQADIAVNLNITNNSLPTSIIINDSSADVKKITNTSYQATLDINGDSSGFVIGPIDANSDYSIEIDPVNLSTMTSFLAANGVGDDIVISQGASGIGGPSSVDPSNSVSLTDIAGLTVSQGGGNQYGLRSSNTLSNQGVYVTHPVDLSVSPVFNAPPPDVVVSNTPSVPTQILKFEDSSFNGARWSQDLITSGRNGSTSASVKVAAGGNPGAYRRTTHSSITEPRRLVITARPTEAFFGPGSIPALPWPQSYATDQFGNQWVFIRETTPELRGGSPRSDGFDDVFLRDATADETWNTAQVASNVFGGPSGIASGTRPTNEINPSVQPATIITLHTYETRSYTPSSGGELFNITVNFDVLTTDDFIVGSLIKQNGNYYLSTEHTAVKGQWTPMGSGSFSRLDSGSFNSDNFGLLNGDGTVDFNQNPDFVSGSAIKVGYFTKSIHTGSTPESKVIGVDNFVACLTVPESTNTLFIPDNGVPTSIIDEKGAFVDEAASTLPRGATGSPQDPCVANITVNIRSSVPQSVRYILTNEDGVKFYSDYRSLDLNFLNQFQLLSLGGPTSVVNPPSEFTQDSIDNKSLNLSLVAGQLTSEQEVIAGNLDGISRLTYVQEILGSNGTALPNGNKITDIEFEFRNTPVSSIDFGYVTATIGIPGAYTEVVIDDFDNSTSILGRNVLLPSLNWDIYSTGGGLQGNPSKVIFSRLSPGGGCQMHYKQVEWYERGWRIGACCGALVEYNGTYYIVVKRSIGADTSCGGGESLNTVCISQYIDSGDGHPAIAWPTLGPPIAPPGGGGDEFLGIPTSGFVNFVRDDILSSDLLSIISSGGAIKTFGDPINNIPFILFPSS